MGCYEFNTRRNIMMIKINLQDHKRDACNELGSF